MKIFIYYFADNSNDTGHDIAAVKAKTKEDAVKILEQYYTNVGSDNVKELTFKDYNNRATNIMILSDY